MNADIQRADPLASAAVLTGCCEYPQSDFPAVPAVKHNLERLKAAFTDSQLWGLDEEFTRSFLDMSGSDLLRRVGPLARLANPAGIFVLYFCGHAERHRGTLYLAPADADRARPEDSMIPVGKLFKAVDDAGVSVVRKLLILDCCYAGQAIRETPGEPLPPSLDAGKGWYVMAAASPSATAMADPGRSTSLFTGALLEAFQGSGEAPRSLSPGWVFDRARALMTDKGEPQQSSAAWRDQPWLCNRLFREPPRTPYTFAPPPQENGAPSAIARPHGFGWPTPDPLYVGRVAELERARARLRPRAVLPVVGPRYAGKNAFVRQLLSSPELRGSWPPERPWLRFTAVVRNASAESPVLEAIAKALEIRLQDLDQDSDPDDEVRRALIIERLTEHARGHTLLLEIDCERLGYDSRAVRGELDRLLGDPFFRDSVNIVISRVDPHVDGSEQLDQEPAIQLRELADEEAAGLLTSLVAREQVTVDGAAVMAGIPDPRLRLPGILSRSARGLLDRMAPDVAEVAPGDVIEALLQSSVPGVAKALAEVGCVFTADSTSDGPQPLAVLTVWALADELPLPRTLLESPQIGFARRTLQILADARILSRTSQDLLEIGQVSRQALRSLLVAALSREERLDDPFAPLPLDRELDELFGPAADAHALDSALAAAAFSLLLTAVGRAESDDEIAKQSLRGMQWVLGWIEDEGHGRLPLLHEVLQFLLLGHAGDDLFLPVSPAGAASADPLAATLPLTLAAQADPLPGSESPEDMVGAEMAPLYQLCQAVARLTVAARASGIFEQVIDGFLAAARDFSAALAACPPEHLPTALLRSADVSLALTGRRLSVTGRLLDIRRSALPALLAGAYRPGPGRAGRITLAVSWLLNSADALLDTDAEREARGLVEQARRLVGELPDVPGSTHSRLQLSSRVSHVHSRCLQDPLDRWVELRTAVDNAATGLRLVAEEGGQVSRSPWLHRLFDSALLLIRQCSTDEQVRQAVKTIDDALAQGWGEPAAWPVNVRLTMARFLRAAHARLSEPEEKVQGARRAVGLLSSLLPQAQAGASRGDTQETALADADHARVLVTLAQTEGFLAKAHRANQRFAEARASMVRAEQHASEAVRVAPSTASYSVWLRQALDLHRTTARTGAGGKESNDKRRACTGAVRKWLAQQTQHTHWHALLDLRCLESDWAEEGSLRRACERPDQDFMFLKAEIKARLINDVYTRRRQKLTIHRKRYGDSVELCILETRLEREYQRWKAITTFGSSKRAQRPPHGRFPQVDNEPVFSVFGRASELWPGNARLQEAAAEFRRYIWEDSAAVAAYEHLARTARDGETWLRAKIMAAEALLAQVQHDLQLPAERRLALLRRAEDHLRASCGQGRYSYQATLLSNRVAFELEQYVAWDQIDSVFETIVGENYTGTVGRFLNHRYYGETLDTAALSGRAWVSLSRKPVSAEQERLRAQFADLGIRPPAPEGRLVPGKGRSGAAGAWKGSPVAETRESAPETIAELLLADFTSVDLLRGMGQLYLARAESLVPGYAPTTDKVDVPSPHAAAVTRYARHAYDCFDGCRVLQEARSSESSVGKFLRGRSITLGAAAAGSPDPFTRPDPGEASKTMLEIANGLLHTACMASVGRFNQVCLLHRRQNATLMRKLGVGRR